MLKIDNATFRFIPKVGSQWVEEVIRPILIDLNCPDNFLNYHRIEVKEKTDYIFTFVRNPWAWYVSFYNFLRSEESYEPDASRAEEYIRSYAKNLTFEDFIFKLFDDDLKYTIRKLNEIDLKTKRKIFEPLFNWSSGNKSPYSFLVNEFTRDVTFIGRTENLRNDLKYMLKLSNNLTEDLENRIDTIENINVGLKVNYRDYYSDELKLIIENDMQEFIKKYNYKF
jgi:Sulfotransferase family